MSGTRQVGGHLRRKVQRDTKVTRSRLPRHLDTTWESRHDPSSEGAMDRGAAAQPQPALWFSAIARTSSVPTTTGPDPEFRKHLARDVVPFAKGVTSDCVNGADACLNPDWVSRHITHDWEGIAKVENFSRATTPLQGPLQGRGEVLTNTCHSKAESYSAFL
jgi:hypothetical protein